MEGTYAASLGENLFVIQQTFVAFMLFPHFDEKFMIQEYTEVVRTTLNMNTLLSKIQSLRILVVAVINSEKYTAAMKNKKPWLKFSTSCYPSSKPQSNH